MIRSCYHLPAARWHRKRTVPPAAGIRLHFQSLKGGLINSIIHSFTFMAQPNAARQGNVPPLMHLCRPEWIFAGSKRGSLAARCTSLHLFPPPDDAALALCLWRKCPRSLLTSSGSPAGYITHPTLVTCAGGCSVSVFVAWRGDFRRGMGGEQGKMLPSLVAFVPLSLCRACTCSVEHSI